MAEQHPEPPPNHENFVFNYAETECEFRLSLNEKDVQGVIQYASAQIDLSEVPPAWRPFIAAVAEVAWRKIAETTSEINPHVDANLNAEAWRAWGEKEEKS